MTGFGTHCDLLSAGLYFNSVASSWLYVRTLAVREFSCLLSISGFALKRKDLSWKVALSLGLLFSKCLGGGGSVILINLREKKLADT